MSRVDRIRPEFVDRIPKTLEEGVIYISEKYSTAAHNCCCGCGVKIVTPLKPGRWQLTQKRGRVSLQPSIGNWSSDCQSHYWIDNDRVVWARRYTPAEIAANREDDRQVLERVHAERHARERGFWGRLWDRVRNWF